jgi:hypothetical protein
VLETLCINGINAGYTFAAASQLKKTEKKEKIGLVE